MELGCDVCIKRHCFYILADYSIGIANHTSVSSILFPKKVIRSSEHHPAL